MTCPHDYTNPTRKGRAHYVCPLCGADITMELVMVVDSDERGNHGGSSKRDNRGNDENESERVHRGPKNRPQGE